MRYELALARDPDSPAEARRALANVAGRVDPDSLDDARLLVSELVTNAVRHAGLAEDERIGLVLEAGERCLRVEVSDPGRGFELSEPAPDPHRPSGWGLYLVRELADRWGVERESGTRVWFELDDAGR